MKMAIKKTLFPILLSSLLLPASLCAQEDKEPKEKKDAEQIIITRKGNKDEKIVVEVNGDKVTVNGKDVSEDKNSDVSVQRHKIKDTWAYSNGNTNYAKGFRAYAPSIALENRAMLGVTSEKAQDGVSVQSITKESAAAKAGLKTGDVITKIDDKKISDPDDLSEAIRTHKPGEKVVVTYKRDNKEQKATTELTKWKGMEAYSIGDGTQNFNFDMGDLNMAEIMPRLNGGGHIDLEGLQRLPGTNFSWSTGGPKLGMSVQDTEDGKGVEVLDVDEDGTAAKAGIKEDDIITEVDGKAVNSADEIARIMKESKDKGSVKMKLQRGNKTESIDVKIPKKLKSADL